MSGVSRPLLRYFGGKFAIADWIISNFPQHRIYCEPFGGGGSILLSKPRAYSEIYNDMDGDICNVFRVMRDDFDRIAHALRHTPFSREEYDLSYHDTDEPLERARRTIVRSWMGFGNSVQRAGGKSGFQAMTDKTGSTKSAQWASYLDVLDEFKIRLRGVVIENRNALEVIRQQDTAETLFFVDPPYVHSTRLSGRYKFEMTNEQHEELCAMLSHVKRMVVLCGYDNEIYNKMGWAKESRKTNCMASTERMEVLWFNKNAWNLRPQINLFQQMDTWK